MVLGPKYGSRIENGGSECLITGCQTAKRRNEHQVKNRSSLRSLATKSPDIRPKPRTRQRTDPVWLKHQAAQASSDDITYSNHPSSERPSKIWFPASQPQPYTQRIVASCTVEQAKMFRAQQNAFDDVVGTYDSVRCVRMEGEGARPPHARTSVQ